MGAKLKSLVCRFLDKCDRPKRGCWEWTAYKDSEGYGRVTIGGGHSTYAHRLSWRLWRGEIPRGLCICHKCDNPGCVRPDHLFLGTPKDNVHDSITKQRHRLCAPRAKLTTAQVQEIRALYSSGAETQKSLSHIFGVDRSTIGYIVRNKVWRFQ